MIAPVQQIRISQIANGVTVATVTAQVEFDFTGYDMQEMMTLLSGGQSPRVTWQAHCRSLNRDDFLRLGVGIQRVNVKSLYAPAGKRTTVSVETVFLRMTPDRRDQFISWAMEHVGDPVMAPPQVKRPVQTAQTPQPTLAQPILQPTVTMADVLDGDDD
jgi:hypothetical protein